MNLKQNWEKLKSYVWDRIRFSRVDPPLKPMEDPHKEEFDRLYREFRVIDLNKVTTK